MLFHKDCNVLHLRKNAMHMLCDIQIWILESSFAEKDLRILIDIQLQLELAMHTCHNDEADLEYRVWYQTPH